ncbi:12566_t:CDS:2, partial [Dentiscutata erythropus]
NPISINDSNICKEEYKQAIAELQQKLEEQRSNEYIVMSNLQWQIEDREQIISEMRQHGITEQLFQQWDSRYCDQDKHIQAVTDIALIE